MARKQQLHKILSQFVLLFQEAWGLCSFRIATETELDKFPRDVESVKKHEVVSKQGIHSP